LQNQVRDFNGLARKQLSDRYTVTPFPTEGADFAKLFFRSLASYDMKRVLQIQPSIAADIAAPAFMV
jgi:hypothetical protein